MSRVRKWKVYIVETGEGIREGRLFDDYRRNRAHCVGTISLRQFAQEFAEAYRNVARLKV